MGFRFRRSIKVIPGVSLNLGKTGVSVSAGVRGAKVTVGEKGVRQTIGLPGSGLSHTTYTKFDKSNNNQQTYTSTTDDNNGVHTLMGLGVIIAIVLAFIKPVLVLIIIILAAIFILLKRWQSSKQLAYKNSIIESAKALVHTVNESLKTANESDDYSTRVENISIARASVSKLKEISFLNPEINLTSLNEVMKSIEELELENKQYESS